MVRGALPFARLAVDARAGAARGQGLRHQDMIDAQPLVLRKGELAIVPPTVQTAFAMVKAESVHESPGAEVTEGGTRFRVEQHGVLPRGRIVDIP